MHIRSLGNWTNKLYDYFQDMSTNEKADAGYNPYELERVGSMTKCERKMSNLGRDIIFSFFCIFTN